MPVVTRLGIDVVHYSTVVVAATGIGLFLPPIGVGFFIACGIANVPSDRATRAMMPYVYMMCVGLLVVILVPWFTLMLPRLLGSADLAARARAQSRLGRPRWSSSRGP